MKILLLFLIFYGSSLLIPSLAKIHFSKTYYYFCVSRAWSAKALGQKQHVLYTGIQDSVCDQELMRTKAKEWGNFVHANCQNENGCTSDLNSYHTLDQAKNEYDKMLSRLADTARYIAIKVNFR